MQNKTKIILPLLSLLLVGGIASCSGGNSETTTTSSEPPVVAEPITSIKLSRHQLGLLLVAEYDEHGDPTGKVSGEEFQLEFSTLPRQALTPIVKFSSTDEKVATVDEKGLVKAVGEGRCVIMATSEDGNVKQSCPVYVSNSATKSQAKKVADKIITNQTSIKVDTVKASCYWNNKITKNGVVQQDTYFDREMIVSKENAYFYFFDQDTYYKVQDGSPSYSDGGYIFYTNEYYDTYILRVGNGPKNYMVADATSYISQGKSRFQATCAVLDSFFTSGSGIATSLYTDILGNDTYGPLNSINSSKRRGSSKEGQLILSTTAEGRQVADRDDEEDYYIPAGTEYKIELNQDYVLDENIVKSQNVYQGMNYTLNEDKIVNGFYLDYEYSYQNIELIYPDLSQFQKVDSIFDL